jgi:hypothetical protein
MERHGDAMVAGTKGLPLEHRVRLAAFLALSALCTSGQRRLLEQAAGELTAEQSANVERGRQVVLTHDEPSSPWPRMHVYQFIDATPEEAAAVFTDYERHSTYIPNLRESRISYRADELTAEVDYVLRVPLAPDERYTVRDRLSIPDDGESYLVTWTLVRASSTRATDGSVRFERYWNEQLNSAGTLMVYSNFVTPGSRLARLPFVRGKAMAQMRDTAGAIAAQVERQRAGDRTLLERQLAVLRQRQSR